MRVVELTEIQEAIRTVAERDPDKVNPTCQYTNEDGSACCIIGNAFDVLGVPRPPFESDFFRGGGHPNTCSVDGEELGEFLAEHDVKLDSQAVDWAYSVQVLADQFKPYTWREAYEAAVGA